jgi:succinate dehydrogenase / fumarate reductase cytochrome b subunit
MKFAYYPGCSAKTTCPELDQSMKAVAKHLELDLAELEVATCTGSRQIRDSNEELFLTLNARTLALAERLERDVMTVCATCLLKITDNLAKVGLEYRGSVEVTHILWVLLRSIGAEQLARKIVRPLRGLRVAPFYGCHILRPKDVLGFDDPDSPTSPTSLDSLIRLLGAEPVDYDGKKRCCGFHVLMTKEDLALKISGRRLTQAREGQADCVVTTCPLCHSSLDPYQSAVESKLGKKIELPIVHLPQLLGLGLGISAKELRLEGNAVSTAGVLEKIALEA